MICPVCRGKMLLEGGRLVCVVCGEEIQTHYDEPKWIPVTERLPEDLKLVLAAEDGIVFTAYCAHYCGEEEVFVEWHDIMHHPASPTHWMPLPPPPKEEI